MLFNWLKRRGEGRRKVDGSEGRWGKRNFKLCHVGQKAPQKSEINHHSAESLWLIKMDSRKLLTETHVTYSSLVCTVPGTGERLREGKTAGEWNCEKSPQLKRQTVEKQKRASRLRVVKRKFAFSTSSSLCKLIAPRTTAEKNRQLKREKKNLPIPIKCKSNRKNFSSRAMLASRENLKCKLIN